MEFGVFVALAAGAHLVVAASVPDLKGAQAAGNQGTSVVSLQAASATVAAMVEVWERPPDLAVEPAAPETQQLATPVPQIPQAQTDSTPPMQAPQPLSLAVPQSESLPNRSVTASPPPPEVPDPRPETETARLADIRPTARPKDLARQAPAQESRKQKKSPVTSRSSALQKASGQGSGANAGTQGQQRPATLNAGQIQSLTAQWGAKVRRKIEQAKRYPAGARGASGTVTVRITVGRDGSLRGVSLAGSSGDQVLDKAALRAVRASRRFPSAPNGLTKPSYTFTLAMTFNS